MNKSQLFKTAWEIAKNGQQKFGGNVKEYFSESLKLAYKLRGGITMEFEKYEEKSYRFKDNVITLGNSKRQPAWLAEVNGLNEKYGLNRKFIDDYEDIGPNWIDFKMEEGKIWNWSEQKEQHFGIIEDGKLFEIAKNDVVKLVK